MENLKNILENRFFITFITSVIIINALTLGLETSPKITQSRQSLQRVRKAKCETS